MACRSVTSKAFKLYTAEGSRFTARFDPEVEKDGVTYGRIIVMGYSQVADQHLKIVGISAEPEEGGRLLIESRPWSVEVVEGEEVPLYEYETISRVVDITHLLGELSGEEKEKVDTTLDQDGD